MAKSPNIDWYGPLGFKSLRIGQEHIHSILERDKFNMLCTGKLVTKYLQASGGESVRICSK